MTSKNRPSAEDQNHTIDGPRVGKKPYQRPEFRFEKVFETMALSCGKIRGNQGSCRGRLNRKNS